VTLRLYISTFVNIYISTIYWINPSQNQIYPSSKYVLSQSETSMTIINVTVPIDAGDYKIRGQIFEQGRIKIDTTTTTLKVTGKLNYKYTSIPNNFKKM